MRPIITDNFRGMLIVADNDVGEGARSIVERLGEDFPLPIHYVVEPEHGIASVRNRLVVEATALQAEYIAFVDDDMIIEPGWLRELVSTAISFDAAAVRGRYGPLFDDDVPTWVRKSGYWGSIDTGLPTGSELIELGTGGTLFHVESLQRISATPFDTGLGKTGGEDVLVGKQLMRTGMKAVACSESISWERISSDRASSTWMIKRGWADGLIRAYIFKQHRIPEQSTSRFVVGAIVRMAKHAMLMIASTPRGRAGVVPKASNLASAAGRVVGLSGLKHEQYRTIHGR